MAKRPLVVFITPQAANIREYYRPRTEAPSTREDFEAVFEAAGLDYEIIPPMRWPWNPFGRMHGAFEGLDPLRGLWLLFARRRAAVVLSYSESPPLIPLWLRRLFFFKPPIVMYEISWSVGWAYREWLARQTIPRADHVVVHGRNQIGLLHQTHPRLPPVEFQPVSTDVVFFSPRPATGEPRGILSVGLDHGRDFDLLLQATQGMDVPVRIKGGRKKIPFDAAAHPNVELIEKFLQPVDFRQMYADAAIVAITTFSTPNACGVTSLLEAMAMEKPIIVSDNPALRDYFPPPDACVIVPIGDRDALRAAIERLLADPAAAAAMARRGREYLLAQNNPVQCYERMAALMWRLAKAAGTA